MATFRIVRPILLVALLSGLALATPAFAQRRDPWRDARVKMVTDYIEREGVKDDRVLGAMLQVPRHEFVPPSLRGQAYFDQALAIGHKQTISPPFVVAYMTESIEPKPTDKILEIGTGSGYQAAVLSNLCQEVYSIEIVEPLGKMATERLRRLGYKNVTVKIGDGYQGWEEHAPFDKIIVTCSPENVPQPLADQLKEGGKMIIPLGERYQQTFHLIEKKDGKLVPTKLIPTLFVPMTGAAEDQRKVKPDPIDPQLANGGFELDENKDGLPDLWHYQRQTARVETQPAEGTACLELASEDSQRLGQAIQGMALDGNRVASVVLQFQYRTDNLSPGLEKHERPSISVHYYDDLRREIGEASVGALSTNQKEWESVSKVLPVPQKTREAIVRISLNGATGKLYVDDMVLSGRLR